MKRLILILGVLGLPQVDATLGVSAAEPRVTRNGKRVPVRMESAGIFGFPTSPDGVYQIEMD